MRSRFLLRAFGRNHSVSLSVVLNMGKFLRGGREFLLLGRALLNFAMMRKGNTWSVRFKVIRKGGIYRSDGTLFDVC